MVVGFEESENRFEGVFLDVGEKWSVEVVFMNWVVFGENFG